MLGGNAKQHCDIAEDRAESTLRELERLQSRFERSSNRCRTARKAAANLMLREEQIRSETRWTGAHCTRDVQGKMGPVAKFREQMESFSNSCDMADRGGLGFLPEFGNVWPLYLVAGTIGLWLWNGRKT